MKAMRLLDKRCSILGTRPSTLFIDYDEIAMPLENNALKIARWRDWWHGERRMEGEAFGLESLVYDTWTFVATDPRDTIYGILGLLGEEVRREWVVDYEMEVEEAFAFATRRVIRAAGNLGVLGCVQDRGMRKIGGPSWVPDFGVPYVNKLCNGAMFNAGGAGGIEEVCLESGRWDVLRVVGAQVDEIVEVANERNNYVNSMMLLESSWFELAMLLPHEYHGTGQSRAEVLWRTLCADQDATGDSLAPKRYGGLFRELLCGMVMVQAELEEENCSKANPPPGCAPSFEEAMKRAREKWTDIGWNGISPEELREKTISRPRFLADPKFGWLVFTLLKMQILARTESGDAIPDWDFLEEFKRNPTYVMRVKSGDERMLMLPKDAGFVSSYQLRYGKRKLFFTKHGYLGLGPESAQIGDSVCIFRGAAGPFVCRCRRDEASDSGTTRFQIVGESYVHGIMHGEATRMDHVVMEEVELV